MINDMLAQWLVQYKRLDTISDRQWDKVERYTNTGDWARAERAAKKMAVADAEMNGMLTALNLFGYKITFHDGEYKVILEDGKLLSVE